MGATNRAVPTKSGTIRAQINGPHGVYHNNREGLPLQREREGADMTKHSQNPSQISEHQQLALDYLHLTRQAYAQAQIDRTRWIKLARKYGLPWDTIGHALGITPSGARMILHRAEAVK